VVPDCCLDIWAVCSRGTLVIASSEGIIGGESVEAVDLIVIDGGFASEPEFGSGSPEFDFG
jgi:hypothetical protein